jgi:hypothetical protein
LIRSVHRLLINTRQGIHYAANEKIGSKMTLSLEIQYPKAGRTRNLRLGIQNSKIKGIISDSIVTHALLLIK